MSSNLKVSVSFFGEYFEIKGVCLFPSEDFKTQNPIDIFFQYRSKSRAINASFRDQFPTRMTRIPLWRTV
jgi:hypothetical protein